MSNKASIAALDELITRCEQSMLQPFVKRAAVPANSPDEEAPAEPTVDEKLSEDDELLAEFYASQGEDE